MGRRGAGGAWEKATNWRVSQLVVAAEPLKRVTRLCVKSDAWVFDVSPTVFSAWTAALAKNGWKTSLEELVLPDFHWPDPDVLDHPPPLPLSPRHLVIQCGEISPSSLRRLIPSDETCLCSFDLLETVEDDYPLRPTTITTLAHLLPSSIRVLKLKSGEDDDEGAKIDRDLNNFPFPVCLRPLAPPDFFTSFPNLEHLTLDGVRGLAVSSLASLATSSPRLRELLLPKSVWSFPENKLDEAALALVLAKPNWPGLEKVHLGILPLEWKEPPAALDEVCGRTGVELEYELCGGKDPDEDDESD